METLLITLFASSISCNKAASASFNIQSSNTSGPTIPDEYVSVTFDSSADGGWPYSFFTSTQIKTLAKGYSPAIFRYGGTAEDEITYCVESNNNNHDFAYPCLNSTKFFDLTTFAKTVGWNFVFGLNEANPRYSNNTWDPSNAITLMQAVIKTGDPRLVFAYELGNEPDLYHNNGLANITGTQEGYDFSTLYKVVKEQYNGQSYIPEIWGNDNCCQWDYFRDFLSAANSDQVNKITWHQYYCNGKTTPLYDFWSVKLLDNLIDDISGRLNESHTLFSKTSPVLLGETSNCYGGGAANSSASFAAGFMWLDKLGLAGSMGIYAVCRQEFYNGNYALVGHDFIPNPDYWTGYLFKNLVGNKVVYVDDEFTKGRAIRTYAFCTRTKAENSVYDYPKGSVTAVILNTYNTTNADVTLNVVDSIMNINANWDEYILTSYPDVPNSRDIYLNGDLINLSSETELPVLNGKSVNANSQITMPPLSYGFVVISGANAKACM